MVSLTLVLIVTAAFAAIAARVMTRSEVDPAMAGRTLVAQIDRLLPQTQCGQCTYAGCLPYAQAMAAGAADINQCPPGGDATAARLARLLGRPAKPVDLAYGDSQAARVVAWIDEDVCIGCARCLPACPVDAIVGASRYTHTVITAECTGCKLCLPPCPVDCIEMRAVA